MVSEAAPKELALLQVIDTNRMNQRLLMGDIDPESIGLRRMTGKIFEVMQNSLDGFAGGFGIGFPYHSMGEGNRTIPNPEFARYTSALHNRLEAELVGDNTWPCVSCQENSDYNPAMCRNCTLTGLKPRDVMKALPDIDTLIVMDQVNQETLSSIWRLAKESGFTQSDFSVADSISRVNNVLSSFELGEEPDSFLPIDLHVISKQDFLKACREISTGKTSLNTEIWSMYADWKLNEDIDFWFDFIFSATPYEETMADNVYEAVVEARKAVAESLTNYDILRYVTEKSHRANVLLGNLATREAFHRRIDRWRD